MNGPERTAEPKSLVDEVTPGSGGAMTDEVGVITGALTVATIALLDESAEVAVQCAGA
ncbi:hypothetical protein U9R90_06220 [Streptomyces sp. E11-3]|uniref:hypothetical protein n=1 Tax=Streptomyces sp. E11-3 TaxID=3110112 RepID=UPI0039807239